ncbi:MAG: sigma-70 family RNA polymerase sigma factor [Rubricoccaceae bacterium]
MALDDSHRTPLPSDVEVTALLQAARDGDRTVLDALFAHVYAELRRLAHQVRRGRAGHTLNTTALVHEAYLKLVPSASLDWESRGHFFGVAARAMRQILVDAARQQVALKRGGGAVWAVTFEEGVHGTPVQPSTLLDLDAALVRLEQLDARRARVVEHRFFAGLTTTETAKALALSTATVERDWRAARAWLTVEMNGAAL